MSGLLYRRDRYCDPNTGRFTQEDPIGLAGGLNLYGYANGDPVNFSDPFGLSECKNRDGTPIPAEKCLKLGDEPGLENRSWDFFDAFTGISGTVRGFFARTAAKAVARWGARKAAAAGAGRGMTIALGLSDHLDEFAARNAASTWRLWGATNFRAQFTEAMSDASNQILFNLDGVDVWGGFSAPHGVQVVRPTGSCCKS